MCGEEHEDRKSGTFKAQKSKGVTLAIWFISQIRNKGQAVIHFSSERIVTCYPDCLVNKNENTCFKCFLYYCPYVFSLHAYLLKI
jgi:hypothetical protein